MVSSERAMSPRLSGTEGSGAGAVGKGVDSFGDASCCSAPIEVASEPE